MTTDDTDSRGQTYDAEPGALWAIVLGHGRPEDAARRSSLKDTLERVALAIPAERTVVSHPRGEDGATPVMLPISWIRGQDPDATVAVFPADQVVNDPRRFMDGVAKAACFVDADPRWIVLLGAEPTASNTGHGWIERGEPLDAAEMGPAWRRPGEPGARGEMRPAWRVRRVLERPSPERARIARARGALWNTGVLVTKVATLAAAVRHATAAAPAAELPRALVRPCAAILAVMSLGDVAWCDRGAARRARHRSRLRLVN